MLLNVHRASVCGNQMLWPEPTEVKTATSQYISENNPVSRLLSERYTVTNNHEDRVTVEEMYHSFVEDSAEHIWG